MTSPSDRSGSPADERSTDALPRRRGDSMDWPQSGDPQYHRPEADTPHTGPWSAQPHDTTVLRRPDGPPGSPSVASNVPSAPSKVPRADREPAHLPPYTEPTYPAPLPLRGSDPASSDTVGPAAATSAPGASDEKAVSEGARPPRGPRKITVTRVAAMRSRELTQRAARSFHGAVSADGADRSGLGHLTYAVMGNYAVDAALMVSLANTLFFAAATAESTTKVLLYLVLTVAPFGVIAPLIGPLLDTLQRGRRWALAASGIGRAALAVTMAMYFDSWVIYPCALGMMVLSKSFGVLKAALTPRVLPGAITLVKTNSRLTVFGLIAGGVSGAIATGIAALSTSAGALWFTGACCLMGAWLCLRIPKWVESTEGEVPIRSTGAITRRKRTLGSALAQSLALPRTVASTLWAGSLARMNTGFLTFFAAFVIKTRYESNPANPTPGVAIGAASSDDQGWMQMLLLGAVGAAAGAGSFLGNALGARLPLRAPVAVAQACVGTVIAVVVVAFLFPGLVTTAAVALVAATASSLAKVCLDSTLQQELPEVSRASAFGRSESILQLTWVFGAVIGLLIGGVWALGGDLVYQVGFGILGGLLLVGLTQSILVRTGHSMLAPLRPSQRKAATSPGGQQ